MNGVFNVEFPALGWNFTINRVAFNIFGISIYWYGILIAAAVALGVFLAIRQAKRFRVSPDTVVDAVLYAMIAAIVGARLYYVLFTPDFIKNYGFWGIFDIRQGGIAIFGAIIGGVIAVSCVAKHRKESIFNLLDFLIPYLALGQAIGRWGNFFNQEAFGTNTSLPWGMYSEGTENYLSSLVNKGIQIDPNLPVHPTFLYESIACLLIFVIIVLIRRRKKGYKIGMPLAIYASVYGLERMIVEGLRTDSLMINNTIRVSQVVAMLLMIAGIIVFAYLVKNGKTQVRLSDEEIEKEDKKAEVSAEDDSMANADSEEGANPEEKTEQEEKTNQEEKTDTEAETSSGDGTEFEGKEIPEEKVELERKTELEENEFEIDEKEQSER